MEKEIMEINEHLMHQKDVILKTWASAMCLLKKWIESTTLEIHSPKGVN